MTTTFHDETDPPKRVRRAYSYFVQDRYRRTAILLDTNVPQRIFKAMAQEWRRMRLYDKDIYHKRAARDKERYQVAKDEWMKMHPDKPLKNQRRKKDPKAPKRTQNSLVFYAKEVRHQVRLENPHLNPQDQFREIARRWRALSDESKEDYREMAQTDKRRYARELKSYRIQKVELDRLARIQRSEAKKLARQQAAEAVPQPQEFEPSQPAVAPIQPQQQDAPRQPNPQQNGNP